MGPTARLAHFIVHTEREAIPAPVLHEAKRTLINILAVALAASDDPSVDALEAWGGADGASSVIGRGTAGEGQAALVNGYLAHLQDYDDTHFPTVLHPSPPPCPRRRSSRSRAARAGSFSQSRADLTKTCRRRASGRGGVPPMHTGRGSYAGQHIQGWGRTN